MMTESSHPSANVSDDPKARDLLRKAFEATARWPNDFAGFTADLTVNINGKEIVGSIKVKSPREVFDHTAATEIQK
ncbi:MAG: DUF3386 domain-containing protein, partial [Nitrospira sp.]|nr:DUF3386 domain-containing protein [Nitrospira sp.]